MCLSSVSTEADPTGRDVRVTDEDSAGGSIERIRAYFDCAKSVIVNISVIPALAFTGSVVYAVLGNAAVYAILVSRKAPVRFGWAGIPFYLYRVCVQASPAMPCLRTFALSTNIAALLAIPSWIWFAIAHQ